MTKGGMGKSEVLDNDGNGESGNHYSSKIVVLASLIRHCHETAVSHSSKYIRFVS